LEQTLVLLKPDSIQRLLIGEIISRIESKGLKIVAVKLTVLDEKTAKAFQQNLLDAKEQAGGLQFISVQTSPDDQQFAGFWMMRDLPQP